MSRRGTAGIVIAVLWLVGLGFLVRREYFRPHYEKLAEAGMRLNPGAVFYGVWQRDRQIGFASSTVDTTGATITAHEYLVASLPVGGRVHRTTARTDVTLTRTFRVRDFAFSLEGSAAPMHVTGRVDGDSVLIVSVVTGDQAPDTQRVHLDGPVLLPTLVPMAVMLGETPRVGRSDDLPVFNPLAMQTKQVKVSIDAESLFVLADSAQFDSAARVWTPYAPDTVRGWQIVAGESGAFTGWVDEQGRVLSTTQLGLDLRRAPYEIAFAGWQAEEARGDVVTADRDIFEMTAIAANKRFRTTLGQLTVRLRNADLRGYDLDGGRQALHGDTLVVTREPDSALDAHYVLPASTTVAGAAALQRQPLIQVGDREMRAAVTRIIGRERNARVAAQRLTQWVHDSLAQRMTVGVPDALQVLHARTGDCNEHTQLFVALARTAGLPTRIAAGLAYIDGKFYYHAWPEVYLGRWVAVDPTFGQFPADAAHIRFVYGGLGRQTELLRLMGTLQVDVLTDGDGRR